MARCLGCDVPMDDPELDTCFDCQRAVLLDEFYSVPRCDCSCTCERQIPVDNLLGICGECVSGKHDPDAAYL